MHRSSRLSVVAVALVWAAASSHAGDLEPIQVLRQAAQGIDGLSGAEEIVISDDGAFVYVAAEDQDAIGIFSLDEAMGTLAFVALEENLVTPKSPKALALSPDAMNQHLYMTSQSTDQIVWYDRDPVTGLLNNEMSITGDATIGMMQPWSVAVSGDGLNVYVVGRADDSIAVFDRDLVTGALSPFRTFFDLSATGMTSPFEVRLSPDDTQVFVASQGDADVVGLAFDRIPGPVAMGGDPLVEPGVPIPVPVAGRGSSKAVTVSPDGTSVYFGVQTDIAGNPGIAAYDRDPMTNALTPSGLIDNPSPSTVVSLDVSPDGRCLLAAADTVDAVFTYNRAEATGALTFFEQNDNLDPIPGGGFAGLEGATSVAITASGAHTVAVAKASINDAINLFVPEPSSTLLIAAALGALGALKGRRERGETPI